MNSIEETKQRLLTLAKTKLDFDNFQVGSFCDSVDELSVFCVGQIFFRKGNLVSVRHDGWSDKHNQVIDVTNKAKIVNYRLNTVGYTGQKSVAYRSYNFSADLINETLSILKDSIANFGNHEIDFYTQKVRGTLFTNIDIILTNDYSEENKAEAVSVFINICELFQEFAYKVVFLYRELINLVLF